MYNPLGSDLAVVWDAICAVISFAAVMAVVLLNGFLQRTKLVPDVVTHKIVHLFVGPVFVLTWPLYSGTSSSRFLAAIVPLLFVGLMIAIGTGRIKGDAFVRSMSHTGTRSELLRGSLYYSAVLLIITVIWFYVSSDGLNSATPVALVLTGCIAGGDSFAYIMGRSFGRHVYGSSGTSKSVEGSVGMFIGSFIFSIVLVALIGIEVKSWELASFIAPIAIFSLGAAVIEAISPKNMDNWTIALGVAILMGVVNFANSGFWQFGLT